MVDRASDDLVASFEELDKIEEVHSSHQLLVQQILLRNFRSALSELQAKVNLYEFLNKDQHGFERAKYSTFKETQEDRTNRAADRTNTLFTDPQTGLYLTTPFDAAVDLVGERLTLGVVNNKEIRVESIKQTFGAGFPPSNTERSIGDIENIIDQQSGTFWIKSIIRESGETGGINVQLKLDLPGLKEINYLEIQSAVLRSVLLTQVSYENEYQEITSIPINQEIAGIKKIMLPEVSAKRLFLDFNIPDYLQYDDQGTVDYEQTNILREIVTPAVRDLIIATPEISSAPESGVRYQIGFDNIRVGLSRHVDKSIYVSQPLEVTPSEDSAEEQSTRLAAIVGLKALATRPYLSNQGVKFTDLTEEDDTQYLGSVEYWVVKKDLQGDATVKTTVFPILPMGTTKVRHERLFLTKDTDPTDPRQINNSGKLCFFPKNIVSIILAGGIVHYSGTIEEEFSLYKNGQPFEGTWSIDFTNSVLQPDAGNPMALYVEVPKNEIELGDIFTVSYLPKVSDAYSIQYTQQVTSTPNIQQLVDLAGNTSIRTIRDQLVTIDENFDVNIDKYNLYLMIILRQNTAQVEISPAVEEYTFAMGAKDLLKFEE